MVPVILPFNGKDINSETIHFIRMEEKASLTLAQKCLWYVICGLIIILVVFSIMAVQNMGQKGYDHCLERKCEKISEEFCSKPREIQNCCRGAGGELAVSDNKITCFFN